MLEYPDRLISALAPHPNPIIAVSAPRLRCSHEDFNALEFFVSQLQWLGSSCVFRVSGMIVGPEYFLESIAPEHGHSVEIFGPRGDSPERRAHCLSKLDELPPTALLDAHALWLFTLPSDLDNTSNVLENSTVILAQEFGVPVFLFLPEPSGFEVLELV